MYSASSIIRTSDYPEFDYPDCLKLYILVSEVHKCPVSNVDAMDMFDKCLTWLRWQPEASLSNTAILVQMREMAASKREAARVQPTIDSFFNRK